MDTLLRQIAVALGSSAIVWAIWFFIAKSKNNHKQMLFATVFCCFVFFTMAFSPLAGAAFYGAYALINYVKKMGDAPTQAQQEPQQMQIPLPEEKKETPTKQQPQQYQQQNKEKPAPCEEQARIMKTVTIVFITCFIVLPLVILILFLLFI